MKKTVAFAFLLSFSYLYPADQPGYEFKNWGISKEAAIGSYGYKPVRDLSTGDLKTYKNQIYNHIITINPEIQGKVSVVRTGDGTYRDFIFANNMLCCITEETSNLTPAKQKDLFVKIQQTYGIPTVRKDGEISIYNISSDKTEVIINVRPNLDNYDMKIYFYPKNIFSIILMAGS